MIDLNSLIPPRSPLYLTQAEGINDRGEIAGTAYDQSTGKSLAFLAIPAPAAQIAGDSPRKITCRKHPRLASATTAPSAFEGRSTAQQ